MCNQEVEYGNDKCNFKIECLWNYGNSLVVFIVGVAAGVINTLAGGGPLITLPVLIFLGLPATVANGTESVWRSRFRSVLAVAGFKRKGVSDFLSRVFLCHYQRLWALLSAHNSPLMWPISCSKKDTGCGNDTRARAFIL